MPTTKSKPRLSHVHQPEGWQDVEWSDRRKPCSWCDFRAKQMATHKIEYQKGRGLIATAYLCDAHEQEL